MKYLSGLTALIIILSFTTVFAANNIEIMVDSIPNIKDRYDIPFGFENDVLLQGTTNGYRISATGDLAVSLVQDSSYVADHLGSRADSALQWMFRYDGAALDSFLAGGLYIPGTFDGVASGTLDTMYFMRVQIAGTTGQICIDSVFFIPPGGYWLWDNNGTDLTPTFNNDGSTFCIEYYEYTCVDADGDEYGDPGHPENDCPDDNCPLVYNPTQANNDADTYGDACDNCPDVTNQDQINSDTDSHGDLCDNCPDVKNEDQADADSDGIGDACDTCPNDSDNDIDQDGICGDIDNCPDTENPLQENSDEDSHGDACDNCQMVDNEDQQNSDSDSYGDACDNCPLVDNEDQADADSDGIGDACDPCPNDPDNDIDQDGICGDIDNCPGTENPLQENSDNDSYGDACDNCPLVDNEDQADTDEDGIGDVCDYICGDANSDGIVDISDAVYVINFAFGGGPAPDPIESGDANCDSGTDVSDAVFIINFAFGGGNTPCDVDGNGEPDC